MPVEGHLTQHERYQGRLAGARESRQEGCSHLPCGHLGCGDEGLLERQQPMNTLPNQRIHLGPLREVGNRVRWYTSAVVVRDHLPHGSPHEGPTTLGQLLRLLVLFLALQVQPVGLDLRSDIDLAQVNVALLGDLEDRLPQHYLAIECADRGFRNRTCVFHLVFPFDSCR